MGETMFEVIRARAERIREHGLRLINEYSHLHPVNRPGDLLVRINPSGDHSWDELPPAGKQLQADLLAEVDRFSKLFRVLTQDLPPDVKRELDGVLSQIRTSVEQNGRTWWNTTTEAANEFAKLVDQLVTTREAYSGLPSGEAVVIPDTNALLANPEIEGWRFPGVKRFTLVLTPTILSELDSHKVNHRNESIRKKATKIIQKLKEYRRRGPVHEGVTVVAGHVSLRFIATEPDMSRSLSWFDPQNADDRFLASTLEILRTNMTTTVFIVTSDINMQNKAEMASIPFREVPVGESG